MVLVAGIENLKKGANYSVMEFIVSGNQMWEMRNKDFKKAFKFKS